MIDRINTLIQQSQEVGAEAKAGCQVDAEQLKGELRRPKLSSQRIWSLVDKLTKLTGATVLARDLWQRTALEPLLMATRYLSRSAE